TYAMLFLDFSGYSDVAIGIGRLFRFEVPENFKHVFTATTLTQFWRNWHATLGDWLRETVFIPLGGIRARGWQLSAIVVVSMLLVGLWRGYRWIFVAWGVFHGVALLLENRLGVKPLRAHRTPWWQLGLRYALVQAVVVAGMFAFIGGIGPLARRRHRHRHRHRPRGGGRCASRSTSSVPGASGTGRRPRITRAAPSARTRSCAGWSRCSTSSRCRRRGPWSAGCSSATMPRRARPRTASRSGTRPRCSSS